MAAAPQNDTTTLWSDGYVMPVYVAYDPPPRPKGSAYGYSCVMYVKWKTGDTSVWGYPNRITAYDITPSAGMVVLTTEGPVGHTAYIEAVDDTNIYVSEANFIPGAVTKRSIPRTSEFIRGYR
jgi:hypothetical protein